MVSEEYYKTCILVTLTFVVTLTFDSRSRNIVHMLAGYEMHLSSKYEVNPTNGLAEIAVLAQKCEKKSPFWRTFWALVTLTLGSKSQKTA